MLLLFFSILACNTSNTKWLIYSLSQHLTRLASDVLPFLLNRSKLPICSYYFFLFWPVTLKSVKKEKKSIYACILINKISKKKKKSNFFFFFGQIAQTSSR